MSYDPEKLTKLGALKTLAERIKSKIDALSGRVDGALAEKVDKVAGKGLSANDFTTAYKNKLDAFTIQTSSSAPAAGTANTIITIVT